MTSPTLLAHASAAPVVITGALLLQLLVLAGLFMLLYTYRYTFGAILQRLADLLSFDGWLFSLDLGGPILRLDAYVRARIGDAIDTLEESVALTWHALEWTVDEIGDALVAFGSDVHAAIAGLIDGEIPAQVGASTRPLTDRLSKTNAAQRARDRAEAQARARGIDRLNRDLLREQLSREAGIDAVRGRLNTVVMPGLRALDLSLDAVWGYTRRTLARRLSRVEQLVLGGALTAAAIAALTRVFPYWQCTNVRRFMRGVCRSPFGSLDWLFALAAFVLVALDPERVFHAAEDATDELGGIFRTMAGLD